jgi:DNA-binding SARP family transcriptional activator/Tfp pilus assembly protein PilF
VSVTISEIRYALLGPVTAWRDGHELDLGWAKQQTVLVALLLELNRPVQVSTIIDAVWGERPPRDARNAVQTYVSRLRRVLQPGVAADDAAAVLLSVDKGYRVRGDPARLDVVVFERHLAAAEDHHVRGDPGAAAADVEAALALWRGEPLGGLDGPLVEAERRRLGERHLAALELRVAARLALGHQGTAIADLTQLVAEFPLHERFRAMLMLALYRSGRQADALEVYHDARRRLADELGIDPGAELRDLYERIVRADAELLPPATRPTGCRNDLPRDIADFTGRQVEMRRLLAEIADGQPDTTAVVVGAIDGMAGVGKTTLAVHCAHRLADRYPDGQLFIDLHGNSADQARTDPLAALGTLLRALEVDSARIPADLDGRAALWRAELVDRRVLLVLDDAGDAAQVRHLLPGAPGCLALITSRRQLLDLEAARVLSLDVLPHRDAVAMFTGIVGERRAAAEAEAVDEVVRLCGHLPLALRIAAARLRTRPAWTVRYLADRLAQRRARLAELSAGDRSVATAFALSYRNLTPEQQRLFRLLGLHPGPDIDAHVAAALAGIDPGRADELLESLVDVHLLHQPTPRRYRFHELVGHHARGIAHEEESEAGRQESVRRLLDYYLHTAYVADRAMYPHRPPIALDPSAAGCDAHPLADEPDEAVMLAWFDAEFAGLLGAQRLAVEHGHRTHVWQLAWGMTGYCSRRGYFPQYRALWTAGLAAADQLDDPVAQANAHRFLAHAFVMLRNPDAALPHARQALALTERIGDVPNQGHVRYTLAMLAARQGDAEQALDHALAALSLFQNLDNEVWHADALNTAGWYHACLGHYAEARDCCEQALALHRKHDDRDGEASTLDSLGYIALRAGEPARAVDYYGAALALRRDLGQTYDLADNLVGLGEAHTALGNEVAADEALRQALDLYRSQQRTAEADRIERKLTGGLAALAAPRAGHRTDPG